MSFEDIDFCRNILLLRTNHRRKSINWTDATIMYVLSISIFWSTSYCLLLAICQGLNDKEKAFYCLGLSWVEILSLKEQPYFYDSLTWKNFSNNKVWKKVLSNFSWKWKIRMLLQVISPQMCFMHTCRIFRDTMSFFPCQVPPASAHHISDRPCHDQEDSAAYVAFVVYAASAN